ncbi:MAG TPA: hypothetical protein PK611_04505 [Saprospiraceae bacterium]|jgi:hypothetical protein|nr:hypothetical protein [Saprospiraceae bacterium]HRO07493.1 hypothetical protein [Saprospiraceae bacterium]HRO72911.1 hypothetical protein [Saprospiraceae bacterium]HRP40776.1 hypothetical protein [Saprospiraceae bacterium]
MSEDINPYVRELKTQRLQEILDQFENNTSTETPEMTLAESKRVELMRKMREDTDKKEYMIMLNAIVILAAIVMLTHYIVFMHLLSILLLIVILTFFVFVRRKLTIATLALSSFKNDFDQYLWEGFHLKEMRYAAVKLTFLIFFPVITVFLWDIVMVQNSLNGIWTNFIVALAVSTMGWIIFFHDDKTVLEGIEVDLKALEYM